MGSYVYQYLHPEYGHLYCGRTSNLDKRIYEHNNCTSDNISREYEELLKESIVMYIELGNKAQEIAAEAYCIDKYKPFLNKSLKYDNGNFMLEMKLPKWKMYEPQKIKHKQQLLSIKKEELKINEDILNMENSIKIKKDNLNKMKFELSKIDYEIKMQEDIKSNNSLFGFSVNDIKWFYKHCENKSVKFYSEIYDKIGNMFASGYMYYDSDKNILTLKYWSENNGNDDTVMVTENELFFEITANTLYRFYPDINIYPELYASLLSKRDELLIMNDVYDLKDLINDCDDNLIDSVDRKINVRFKNGKICHCDVELDLYNDIYKGVHNLLKYGSTVRYICDKQDGVLLKDEDNIVFYKKEDIDIDIKNYIFSCKYHHPNRNKTEEEYCNKIISKYKD